MSRILSVACLQTRPMADFAAASAEALALAAQAADGGARLIALPEYCGGLTSDGAVLKPPVAAEADHPVLQALCAFCRDRAVWMVIGSVAVPGPDGRIRNRGFVVDDRGAVRRRYDKIHLFDIQLSETEIYRESALVCPGAEAVVADTAVGRLGYSICYDLRFPHLYRDLARAGAEILLAPAAFTARTGAAHWHLLTRARAVENGAFMVAPCAIGPIPGGGAAYGHSLIVDPWGRVLADGGDAAPGVVQAMIDLDQVAETRDRIPSLRHDRSYATPVPDQVPDLTVPDLTVPDLTVDPAPDRAPTAAE